MERAAMIERLTEATLDALLENSDLEGLRILLKKGFIGYERMTTSGLIREMQMRGLRDYEPAEADDATFDDRPQQLPHCTSNG